MSVAGLFLTVFWSMFALAAATMVALIVYRSWANRRARVEHREREHFIDLIKAWSDRPDGEIPTLADDVSTDLTVDILYLLRGDEKKRLAGRAIAAGVAATLHDRLRHGDARTRILAAFALGNFSDEPTRALLNVALDDANLDVRLTAALSLASNGQAPPPGEVMARLGLRGNEAGLLVESLLTRIAQTDRAGVRALLLDARTEPATKAASAEALARVDDFASVECIVTLAVAAEPWANEVPRYLKALAEIEHPAGAPAVLHCLASPSAEARAAAAYTAGRILAVEALDSLESRLGDGDWWVRFHAAQALLQFGERGESRLRRAARRKDEPARETAALILAERKHAA